MSLRDELARTLWDNNWQVQHMKRDGVPVGPVPWETAIAEGWAGVTWTLAQADAILPLIEAHAAAREAAERGRCANRLKPLFTVFDAWEKEQGEAVEVIEQVAAIRRGGGEG